MPAAHELSNLALLVFLILVMSFIQNLGTTGILFLEFVVIVSLIYWVLLRFKVTASIQKAVFQLEDFFVTKSQLFFLIFVKLKKINFFYCLTSLKYLTYFLGRVMGEYGGWYKFSKVGNKRVYLLLVFASMFLKLIK